MTNITKLHSAGFDLPKGIHAITQLPDIKLGEMWDSIILDEQLKSQLVSQAVLNFSMRPKVSRSVIPLHGVILLVGPPGTGKTSLAKGLAHQVSTAFKGQPFQLLEVDPHSLTSSAMGKTQKAVSELFSQAISEAAITQPTIVLLDEVETLAADRSKMSLDANPIDIHRATDAVLVQLDALANANPNLLFVATSNFPDAIDSAFTSRCDLVLEVPLPNDEACQRILIDCLDGLGKTYDSIGKLKHVSGFDKAAAEFVGLDGRTIRKTVANAIALNRQTALNPNLLDLESLEDAAKSAREHRNSGDQ